MGFYYGDAWDGICEWVDGIGWVDPNEDREEERKWNFYRVTYEWHDSRLIPQGGCDYIMSTSEQEAINQWVEEHGSDYDSIWARLATEDELDKWTKEIEKWLDDLPFD